MKKLLLASAIAALSVSAQAAPQVYGKAFLTVDYNDTTKSTTLNSNASRIGLKGAEALTANTDVVYQLEYRVEVDSADGNTNVLNGATYNGTNPANPTVDTTSTRVRNGRNFESRDTYIGLSNKQYGTLLAGRLSSIDGKVDYANVTQGNVIGGDGVQASFDARRLNNAFAYVSPNYSGVTFMAMYQTDGSADANSLANGGFGVAAQYEPKGAPFRAGASYIQATGNKIARVSGAYDVNPALTVGALYQTHDNGVSGSKKENVATVSAEYKTATPWTAYGQLDFTQNLGGLDVNDQTRLVIGGKYAFNKASTGHVYAGAIDPKSGKTRYGVGGGLEYKF